jgi:hypothetical protein
MPTASWFPYYSHTVCRRLPPQHLSSGNLEHQDYWRCAGSPGFGTWHQTLLFCYAVPIEIIVLTQFNPTTLLKIVNKCYQGAYIHCVLLLGPDFIHSVARGDQGKRLREMLCTLEKNPFKKVCHRSKIRIQNMKPVILANSRSNPFQLHENFFFFSIFCLLFVQPLCLGTELSHC